MKNRISSIVILLFSALIAIAQQPDLEAMDQYFDQMVKDWGVPGVSIGIVKDGQLVFIGNYGEKEIGKKEKPDEHTLYAIASNSKAFTTAMIGMLVQEGEMDWNDKVIEYIPYFELYDPWVSSHTTIRDLLCHRVGLGTFSGDNLWYKSNLTAADFIKRMKHVPQKYDFRAGYGYSNLMYITAGEVIEVITGKTWGENVSERILDPLGMDRTIYSVDDLDAKGNLAMPHAMNGEDHFSIPWTSWENVAATGGLFSSVSDISKWMIFNLNHGIIGQDTLLSKATRNMVWTPHNNHQVDHTSPNGFNRHFNAYGLGWGLSDYHGRLRVGHTGGYDGMLTAVTLIPDEDLGIVVLTNGVKSPFMAATYYALDQFLGVTPQKDYSTDYLKNVTEWRVNDTRIADRKSARVLDTQPITPIASFVGTYESDVYGKIIIEQEGDQLNLKFAHSPLLDATLSHWHYDVWQIHWNEPQAWFSFGTIKIRTDNQNKVIGFDFDVPNDDFFFYELKPYKVE